jgi:hypothetical protein
MYTMATSTSLSSKEADLCRSALKDTTCIMLLMQQVADFQVNLTD